MAKDPDPSKDEASLTAEPTVVWGAWASNRWSADRAPSGWIVLGVLLGLPAAITLMVLLR